MNHDAIENTTLWVNRNGSPKISSLNNMPLNTVKVSKTKPMLITLNNKLSITISGGKLGKLIGVDFLCKLRSTIAISNACKAAKVNKL